MIEQDPVPACSHGCTYPLGVNVYTPFTHTHRKGKRIHGLAVGSKVTGLAVGSKVTVMEVEAHLGRKAMGYFI